LMQRQVAVNDSTDTTRERVSIWNDDGVRNNNGGITTT
jgi:hypothetical protein